jgi:two-component system sensor histidine kinase PilS (NtrC family)
MAPPSHDLNSPDHRELYFFALFRVLEAGILGIVAFTPLGLTMAEIKAPLLLKLAAAGYFAAALLLLWLSINGDVRLRRQAASGLLLDLLVWGVALLAMDGGESGLAMFMIFNLGAGALVLTPAASLGFATGAALILLCEYVFNRLFDTGSARTAAESIMFSVTYLGTALMCQQLRRQMHASEELASRRGEEVASLSEMNQLVIRRMRTGVLVVDGSHNIRLSNEAAWGLLGGVTHHKRELVQVSEALHQSLWAWRRGHGVVPKAMVFFEGGPEVLPRFVAMSHTDRLFLIFLDDSRIYSGRAEELTLFTLGRLSASIAHEIRNPLAAISYSTQPLEESEGMADADRRLLEIIHSQTTRMNGIVQNILDLARQERSQVESVELVAFTRAFVHDYSESHPLETDILQAVDGGTRIVALVDPQHLHQVMTVLVHNALTYGRTPGSPAQVTVAVRRDDALNLPLVEVIDRGPGIPQRVAEQIYTAFFTTSDHGTGLGLYIARQLCEANQCHLVYEPVPGGGSCFRIQLPTPQVLAEGLRPG